MAVKSLGALTLNVTAEIGGFERGMDKAERAAAKSSAQIERSNKRFIESLKEQAEVVGKSRSQILEMQAAQRGLAESAAPYIAKLRESEAALKAGGVQLDKYGISAKQTAAALRGVPAQFTDIVTSIQGGQAPLTVFLQQGGQLKDMFGGIAPAARALGTYVAGLVNPFTVAAAAIGALGFLAYKGSQEFSNYSKALIMSGNAAGVTASQMALMAKSIDAIVGTQYQAAESLAALANTGKVGGANLEKFAEVAVKMQRTMGVALKDIVENFTELGKEPVKASETLNEKFNYLTTAVYEQIVALEKQGRTFEAGTLAQQAYASAMDSRTKQLEDNLGYIQRAWRGVTEAAKESWDAMLGVGRKKTLQDQLGELQGGLGGAIASKGNILGPLSYAYDSAFGGDKQARIAGIQESIRLENQAAQAAAMRVDIENKGVKAAEALNKKVDEFASKTVKMNKELAETKRQFDQLRTANPGSELLKREQEVYAGIRDKFKEKGNKPKEYRDDAATRMLSELRQQQAALDEQLRTDEKLGASARARIKFEEQIAELKEKKVLTADQKSLLANEASILAQLKKNEAIEGAIKAREEEAKKAEKLLRLEEQFAERSRQRAETILSSLQSKRDSYESKLGAFGLGDREREQIESQRAIYREFERMQLELVKNTPEHLLGSDKYLREVDAIKAALSQALADQDAYYQALKQQQMDWKNGASTAIANFLTDAANVAKQTEDLFGNAFKGMEDALTQFVTTGKADFKSLANSILADITRMIIKQQIMGPLIAMLQGQMAGGGGFGGILSSFLGNIFGGGRAAGGPVMAGGFYEVNERGPEMLEMGGRQFLMMGGQSGRVNPRVPSGGGSVTNNFHISGPVDRRTQQQIAEAAGRGVRMAQARNG